MSERNWISVAERMPDHGKSVLAVYKNRYGKRTQLCPIETFPWRTIIGHYLAAKTEVSNGENDKGMDEYDEATDEYYLREGWYECIENWGDYQSVTVCEGTVSHWMLLPEPPEEAEENERGVK